MKHDFLRGRLLRRGKKEPALKDRTDRAELRRRKERERQRATHLRTVRPEDPEIKNDAAPGTENGEAEPRLDGKKLDRRGNLRKQTRFGRFISDLGLDVAGFDFGYFIGALTQLAVILLSAGVVLLFGYHAVAPFTAGVSTTGVTSVSETVTSRGEAILLRDERVLYAPAAGYLCATAEDGSRVAKGETVCGVYAGDVTPLREEMRETEREMALLSRSVGIGATAAGITDSFRNAADEYARLMRLSAAGDLRSAGMTAESFREKLDRCVYLSGAEESFSRRMEQLEKEIATLSSAIGTPLRTVDAPVQGYYFRECDGYEDLISSGLCNGFTEDTMLMLESLAPQTTEGTAGKLVLSQYWYLAVRCEDFGAQDFAAGDTCTADFPENGGLSLEMKVLCAIRSDGGMILLLQSDEWPESFSFSRTQPVLVRCGEKSGYRIPKSALHTCDGYTGVYTLHGKNVVFRRLEIVGEGEGYCVALPYEQIAGKRPATYRVPAFDSRGVLDEYASVFRFGCAHGLKLTQTEHSGELGAGKTYLDAVLFLRHRYRGIPVKDGTVYLYYDYLSDQESVILTGRNLYHGKVLD